MQGTLDSYHDEHGALPEEVTRTYPPDAPVPVPVVDPPPRGRISSGTGQFNNPDNIYEHVRFTTTRGNLVVSAQAPTYQEDSFPTVNDLSRPASQSPQVRYWSLCIVLKDLHTGACLHDSQVHFPAGAMASRSSCRRPARRWIRQLSRGRSGAVAGVAVMAIPPTELRIRPYGVPGSLCVDGYLRGRPG